jgi:hypothetical protein
MDSPYILTIYSAAPGTPLLRETDPKAVSAAGHMYYGLSHGLERSSYGFAPIGHGSARGAGRVADNDVDNYKAPHYSRTIEVTKEQYEKLKEFGREPGKHGFDMNYNGATNSCVDFTWSALNRAGLHTKSRSTSSTTQEGAIKPLNNIDKIKAISAPLPQSPHNKEQTNPLPPRTLMQRLISENDPASRAVLLAEAASQPDWNTNPVIVRDVKDGSYTSLVRNTAGGIESIERYANTGEAIGAKVVLARSGSADDPPLPPPQQQQQQEAPPMRRLG